MYNKKNKYIINNMDGSIIMIIGTCVVSGCIYLYVQARICTNARNKHL